MEEFRVEGHNRFVGKMLCLVGSVGGGPPGWWTEGGESGCVRVSWQYAAAMFRYIME